MVLDGHIHSSGGKVDIRMLSDRLKAAGVAGGVIISQEPDSFLFGNEKHTAKERIENLLLITCDTERLFPFFWIDPLEKDAPDQVEEAVKAGVAGFKIICNRFYPGDPTAMKVYKAIALHDKPILFHSGILWDGQPSSVYNRPAGFEALLDIEGLRFSLAHISWPWVDECIAVYGKFQNAYSRRKDRLPEMFIDITPGTPGIYREEALTKLYTVGYDIENNLIFGSDCMAEDYSPEYTERWIKTDNLIYSKLNLGEESIDKVCSGNLLRFIGKAK